MCGFFTIFQDSRVIDIDSARNALRRIAHRGPDAVGEFVDGNVFLGHRRLSIIDLATGDQPMVSSDGRYIIVFNGEIYNFPELRQCLQGNGIVFRTHSDTEVILEGYRFWGTDVVRHINGMFAFVIWDRLRSRAFGARDRIGIKPLCWAAYQGSLIVASTLEPFFALSGFDRIDPVAVRDLMTFDYIPTPRSILKGVFKFEPGTRFEWGFDFDQPASERYWSPPIPDINLSAPDEFELEALLDRTVKRQMISDVPLGVFLSGGIDSSLTVAMMARHSSKPVRTFSVAFNEGDVDESPIAELVAQRFGTEHTVLKAEEIEAESLLDLLGSLDEPFCDPAFVPTYALSKLTKSHVKVALSGDGGDEVFGGYPKYLWSRNGHHRIPLSSWLDPALRSLPWRPRGMAHLYWRTLSSEDLFRFSWTKYGDFPVFRKDLRQLIRSEYQEAAEIDQYFAPWEECAARYGSQCDMDVLMRADLETYLSENCLVKTDRASMLASLEVRVPYLDEMILDRVLPLPANHKIPQGQLKALLVPIARRLLPKEVWDRPKHGFTVPLDVRLAGAWRPAVEAALDWGESNIGLFDYSYLRRLHKINLSKGGIQRELWNPFVFLAWSMAHTSLSQ
jgi:asparagine synthase (glutamine-hydrolysing)